MVTPILILGPPRSGTSTLARILQTHFGVRFGREQFPARNINPEGVFEDVQLAKLTTDFYDKKINLKDWLNGLADYKDEMVKLNCPWGIKEPRLIALLPIFFHCFKKATIFRCQRGRELTVNSMIKRLGWDKDKSEKYYDEANEMLNAVLKNRTHILIKYPEKKISDIEIIEQISNIELTRIYESTA